MISFLRGTLYYKKPPLLVIDVQGIGYECQAPLSTFYHLPDLGQMVFLYTHFAVREDAHVLYGFFQEQERTLFRSLIKVSTVGPKLALAILSGIDLDLFVRYILEQNIDGLVRIPGVGKKTAERLCVEMRDRLQDWGLQPVEWDELNTKERADCIVKDAISALVTLGFKPQEASRLISLVTTSCETSEDLIRLALQSTLKGVD
jgi:Holliday junction DNA helicase RuvA